jgi:hypothetical protein
MLKIIGLLLGLLDFSFAILAQENQIKPYTLAKLTQESVQIIAELNEIEQRNWGDTLISIYKRSSLETIYFDIANNKGLYLNQQHFKFHRDTQKCIYQKEATVQRVFEFKYLGKKYLCFIFTNTKYSFVYNIFNITNPEKITQTVLHSNKIGSDVFGDFDFDGQIDFLSITDYTIGDFTTQNNEISFKAIAYTFNDNKTQTLDNEVTKQPHYIIGIGNNPNIDSFMVFSQDWLIPLKSPNTKYKDVKYKTHSGGWDGDNKAIYTVEGQRIEAKKYSILLASCDNETKVKEITDVLSMQKIHGSYIEVYLTMEIVKGKIKWLVLAGNYIERRTAKMAYKELEQKGYKNLIIKNLK